MNPEAEHDARIMRRLNEHLLCFRESFANEWVGIFLQGSQNYGLDYEDSDIDTKVIVLPSFEDIVFNRKPVSTTLVMPNDEHVDVKDIRLMFECFRKQNINFVEILFTKYFILNPEYAALFRPLMKVREAIGRYNNYAAVSCMAGMVWEKRKSLTKPHPSAAGVVEKYGYDGKQLHHMERILEFYIKYAAGEPYSKCLRSSRRDELIALKRHCLPLEDALRRADEIVETMNAFADDYRANNPLNVSGETERVLNQTLADILRHAFRRELITEDRPKGEDRA